MAVASRGETYQRRIDPCLDDAIKSRGRAPRQAGRLRGGSQAEMPSDFFQGDIVARLRTGQTQLGRVSGRASTSDWGRLRSEDMLQLPAADAWPTAV